MQEQYALQRRVVSRRVVDLVRSNMNLSIRQ